MTSCTNQCTPGALKCSGTGVSTCKVMSSGCADWDTPVPCASGQTCLNGVCVSGCTDQCTPGQLSCSGNSVTKCVMGASSCYVWDSGTACPTGQTCSGGQCLQGSLTISTSTELCGDYGYAGAFVIQGGAKVTCKTGWLKVKAKTIYIDPSSSIDVSATSSDPGGASGNYCNSTYSGYYGSGGGGGGYGTAGQPGGPNQYLPGKYMTCAVCAGGAGGPVFGNPYDPWVHRGTAGGSSCIYGCSSPCNAWGSGGKGGGVVELWATDKVTVYGKVRADGEKGTTISLADYEYFKYSGGSGGGSGGGILVMAPEVDIGGTATISAKGGAGGNGESVKCGFTSVTDGGSGGLGKIKVLHGDTYSNSGTLVGVQSVSWMPPPTVTSSTHPDQYLYYNDTFANLSVAWTKPYGGAKGYWYTLDQSYNTQLTPANGTYTAAFTASFPATQINKTGEWIFHVLTVHSSDQASTVARRFRVMINGATHTITSSSHPDQNTWYSDPSKKTVTFAWTAPSGVPDASFKGVWYRVDNAAGTPAPSKSNMAGWTFTASKQVLLQHDWQNVLFKDWTYYFHVVSEDTMGNLTKAASTYRFQIGSEPAKLSFFGYLTEAGTGTKLGGATIKLEPYGLTTTTDGSGYFIFNQLYQGAYTLTATLSGYKTASLAVNANASTVPYSFTLSK